jgi:hypothetical protein
MSNSNELEVKKTADNYLEDYHSKLKEMQRLGSVLSPEPTHIKVSKDQISEDRVRKNFSVLKYEFQDTLDKLEKRFVYQLDNLHEVKEDIENTKQELERIHHIKATADNISIMLQKAKQKVLDLDTECQQKIEFTKNQINDLKLILDSEKEESYEKIKDRQLVCDQEISEKWETFNTESESYKSQILQDTELENQNIVNQYKDLIKDLKEKETTLQHGYIQIKQRYEFSKQKYELVKQELKNIDRQIYESEKVQQLQVELKEDVQSSEIKKKQLDLEKDYNTFKETYIAEQQVLVSTKETEFQTKSKSLESKYNSKLIEIEDRYKKESDAKIEQLKLTFSTELKKRFEEEKETLKLKWNSELDEVKSTLNEYTRESVTLKNENSRLKEELDRVPLLVRDSVQKVESDLFEQHIDQSKKMVESSKIKFEKEVEEKNRVISALEYEIDEKVSEIDYLNQKLKRVETHLEYLISHDKTSADNPISVHESKPKIVRSIRNK